MFSLLYLLKYQIIKNPIKTNKKPPALNWLTGSFSIIFNIFFIFDGNKAYKIPSIKRKSPKAITSSRIKNYCLISGLIFPKNLKNSLSGDKIKEVSPPIRAFSYACIAL